MNSSDLYTLFRSDTTDTVAPYLWSEEEVWGYMFAAHNWYIRLMGGISDFTSTATEVSVVTGDPVAKLHPSILRIMSAARRSDGVPVEVINSTDVGRLTVSDYGQMKSLLMDNTSGPVRFLVHGMQKNLGRWIHVPAADDVVDLHIYRLPLEPVKGEDQQFEGIEGDQIIHLLDGMKAFAYRKQDSDAFDAKQAEMCEARFRNHCREVKAEWERYKHKTRVVAYGGL